MNQDKIRSLRKFYEEQIDLLEPTLKKIKSRLSGLQEQCKHPEMMVEMYKCPDCGFTDYD